MGVLKLALIVLLVSISVKGQEDPIVNEDEKIVSENGIDNAQGVVEEAPLDAIDKEPPVEVLTENNPTHIRSGEYRLSGDVLAEGEPIDIGAVNFGTDDGTQNQRQLLLPPTPTSPNGVFNEYGKRDNCLDHFEMPHRYILHEYFYN